MISLISNLSTKLASLQDFSKLFIRLILAYGFYEPAMNKINNFSSIVTWFRDGLHLPFPEINAALATGTEIAGVFLLALGLATRLISLPLMVVMIVAVVTVHGFEHFSAADNGFEIPLYYFLMLFTLVSGGAGKLSLDETLFKNIFGSEK